MTICLSDPAQEVLRHGTHKLRPVAWNEYGKKSRTVGYHSHPFGGLV